MAETKTVIELPNFISVRELAERMEVSPINVIKELMGNGIMASINQEIDFDTASIVAEEMGFEALEEVDPEVAAAAEERLANQPVWRRVLAEEREKDLNTRPPVVTMLGHVDHGKTSLLDIIRQSNIQEGEAGGITQHIGAYQAEREGQLITFLDTPGHQAFTAMRARGAQATDIAILVVAADDGLMPQTREAIDHAKAADVAIIVALNKIDLATANPSLAKQQLSEVGLVPDEWDGDTLVIEVSAKENLGIEDLLEAILLVAEDLNPRANASAAPTGTVIEAKMARGQGVMTTILVQNGTLKVGDTLIIGEHYGRIRAMYDFKGNKVKVAHPSTPVSVSGLNGIPKAGDQFKTVKSEKEARKLVAKEKVNARGSGSGVVKDREAITLDDFFSQLQEGNSKTLSLVVKADVQGSLEPILTSLEKIGESFEEVDIEILLSGTGNVSENDVMLAAASQAVILCFNVNVDSAARTAANSEQIQINNYSIIYKMFEDVEKALKGMLDPVYEDVIIGRAEIRQVFRIRQIGQIAGCYMRTGKVERSSSARLVRDGKLVYSGKISSLKHLQDSVREVRAGFEFGVNIRNWDDYKQGDILEFFVLERVEQ